MRLGAVRRRVVVIMGAVSCFWFKGQSSSPLQWSIPVVQYAGPVQRIHIPRTGSGEDTRARSIIELLPKLKCVGVRTTWVSEKYWRISLSLQK